MNQAKTAAVGEGASVLLFRAAGIETRPVSSAAEAREAVGALLREEDQIIFLTERFAAEMEELLSKYRGQTYPVILPIPDQTGETGYGMRKVMANMEKAIGSNLFEND